jgi:membrane-bound metal-dependent hydrolase YbcI (DUF457 family)
MSNKRRYSFIEEKPSRGGVHSIWFALASIALFCVCIVISFLYQGNAGAIAGIIALCAMLLSAYGFYVGMKSFEEEDVSPTCSVVGAILSGVVTVGWLTLFLTGIG